VVVVVGERPERLDDPGPQELNRVRHEGQRSNSVKLVMDCPARPAVSEFPPGRDTPPPVAGHAGRHRPRQGPDRHGRVAGLRGWPPWLDRRRRGVRTSGIGRIDEAHQL
jgi:hypothetical protein